MRYLFGLNAAIALVLQPFVAVRAADAEKDAAIRYLQSKGLTRVGESWLVESEVRLRNAIDSLDNRVSQIGAAQRRLDQLFQAYDRANVELQAAEESHKGAVERQKNTLAGSPQRTAADDEIKQWRAAVLVARGKVGDSRSFGLQPPVKPAADELVSLRQELAITLLTIRQTLPTLAAEYDVLRRDEGISPALIALGGRQRLGPVGTYERDFAKATTLEQSTLKAPVPITREGTAFRVGAIVNDTVPANFAVHDRSDPALIPASLAESLGISPGPDARIATIKPSAGRQLQVRAVVLSTVQIGPWRMKDVEVYLLPPEGEDLGAQLNRDAIQSQRIGIDAKRLVLQAR